MPPRYAYWTIIAGGLPTSFRAGSREDILPTLKRLKERHPDAELKWFAKGKLWDSPEEARRPAPPTGRSAAWRPGGEHRDPRQKFLDAKRSRNQTRRQERFKRKQAAAGAVEVTAPRRPRTPRPPSGSTKPRGRR